MTIFFSIGFGGTTFSDLGAEGCSGSPAPSIFAIHDQGSGILGELIQRLFNFWSTTNRLPVDKTNTSHELACRTTCPPERRAYQFTDQSASQRDIFDSLRLIRLLLCQIGLHAGLGKSAVRRFSDRLNKTRVLEIGSNHGAVVGNIKQRSVWTGQRTT